MNAKIKTSYHPKRGYHIDSASAGVKLPRCRWFRNIAEMVNTIERLNPGIKIV